MTATATLPGLQREELAVLAKVFEEELATLRADDPTRSAVEELTGHVARASTLATRVKLVPLPPMAYGDLGVMYRALDRACGNPDDPRWSILNGLRTAVAEAAGGLEPRLRREALEVLEERANQAEAGQVPANGFGRPWQPREEEG